VLRLLAMGMSDAAIAESSGIDVTVVATTVYLLFFKLRVETREAATEYAKREGLT
jgi:DNA-binding CsgD family transcriptional regulator